MVLPLIEPETAVSPQGAGRVVPLAGEVQEVAGFEGHSQYREYTYKAEEANGYRFVRFDIEWTQSESSTTEGRKDYPHTTGSFANPYRTADAAAAGAVSWAAGSVWTLDYNGNPGMEQYDYCDWVSALKVTAVFEKIARVPTHLLVNSSDREAPARLVHDPATGLLVADF